MAFRHTFPILAALTMTAAACSDTYDTTYATYAEAQRDGAIVRGWIPDFVPHNARNIRDVHNLDTNEQTLIFYIEPGAVLEFINGFDATVGDDTSIMNFTVEEGRVAVDRNTGRVTFRR